MIDNTEFSKIGWKTQKREKIDAKTRKTFENVRM